MEAPKSEMYRYMGKSLAQIVDDELTNFVLSTDEDDCLTIMRFPPLGPIFSKSLCVQAKAFNLSVFHAGSGYAFTIYVTRKSHAEKALWTDIDSISFLNIPSCLSDHVRLIESFNKRKNRDKSGSADREAAEAAEYIKKLPKVPKHIALEHALILPPCTDVPSSTATSSDVEDHVVVQPVYPPTADVELVITLSDSSSEEDNLSELFSPPAEEAAAATAPNAPIEVKEEEPVVPLIASEGQDEPPAEQHHGGGDKMSSKEDEVSELTTDIVRLTVEENESKTIYDDPQPSTSQHEDNATLQGSGDQAPTKLTENSDASSDEGVNLTFSLSDKTESPTIKPKKKLKKSKKFLGSTHSATPATECEEFVRLLPITIPKPKPYVTLDDLQRSLAAVMPVASTSGKFKKRPMARDDYELGSNWDASLLSKRTKSLAASQSALPPRRVPIPPLTLTPTPSGVKRIGYLRGKLGLPGKHHPAEVSKDRNVSGDGISDEEYDRQKRAIYGGRLPSIKPLTPNPNNAPSSSSSCKKRKVTDDYERPSTSSGRTTNRSDYEYWTASGYGGDMASSRIDDYYDLPRRTPPVRPPRAKERQQLPTRITFLRRDNNPKKPLPSPKGKHETPAVPSTSAPTYQYGQEISPSTGAVKKVIPPPKPVKKPKKKKPMPQIVEETFCLQDILIREEPPKIPDEDIAKPVKKPKQKVIKPKECSSEEHVYITPNLERDPFESLPNFEAEPASADKKLGDDFIEEMSLDDMNSDEQLAKAIAMSEAMESDMTSYNDECSMTTDTLDDVCSIQSSEEEPEKSDWSSAHSSQLLDTTTSTSSDAKEKKVVKTARDHSVSPVSKDDTLSKDIKDASTSSDSTETPKAVAMSTGIDSEPTIEAAVAVDEVKTSAVGVVVSGERLAASDISTDSLVNGAEPLPAVEKSKEVEAEVQEQAMPAKSADDLVHSDVLPGAIAAPEDSGVGQPLEAPMPSKMSTVEVKGANPVICAVFQTAVDADELKTSLESLKLDEATQATQAQAEETPVVPPNTPRAFMEMAYFKSREFVPMLPYVRKPEEEITIEAGPEISPEEEARRLEAILDQPYYGTTAEPAIKPFTEEDFDSAFLIEDENFHIPGRDAYDGRWLPTDDYVGPYWDDKCSFNYIKYYTEIESEIVENFGPAIRIVEARENYGEHLLFENQVLGHVLEAYDLDPSMTTQKLLRLLKTLHPDPLYVKWVNDTNCLIVFDSVFCAQRMLRLTTKLKLRPAVEASVAGALACTRFNLIPATNKRNTPR